MHGYRVVQRGVDARVIEVSGYVVADDGSLTLLAGTEVVERVEPGIWIAIDEIGTQLSGHWPSELLEDVVDEVATLLAVRFGHYVSNLRDVAALHDWRCDDLDSLAEAMLEAVGLTVGSAAEHDAVREVVSRHFDRTAE